MEPAPAVRDLVVAWFVAASRGDEGIIDQHVSRADGVRLIGSDPEEWFAGGVAVTEFLRGEVKGAGGTVRFTPANVEAFREGTVAWASTRLTITLPDGRAVTPRWTAVFHQEDGVWKFVQTHASLGVANNAVGWIYPEA